MMQALGSLPKGAVLDRIKQAPNYTSKGFENLSHTPTMAEGHNFFKVMRAFMNKPKGSVPTSIIPSIQNDLNRLPDGNPAMVWFGHSSYLLKVEGKNILVDPVFSGNASPFSFMVKAFNGSNVYNADNMPEVDILIITHDHYDHLDYHTIKALKAKVKHVVCSLGVAPHLIKWGYDATKITELYWGETTTIQNIQLTAAPARHFSGRTVIRNRSLWSSFILKSLSHQIYIGGDSGYDAHFKQIGKDFGKFDLAILECGQYNPAWKYIHMMPEETVQAAIDLNAEIFIPVHWGKFDLSLHHWTEPIERATAHAKKLDMPYFTPMIGAVSQLNSDMPTHEWWREIK